MAEISLFYSNIQELENVYSKSPFRISVDQDFHLGGGPKQLIGFYGQTQDFYMPFGKDPGFSYRFFGSGHKIFTLIFGGNQSPMGAASK